MICPKCGFDQPDDAYCAFCGISIKKYRQERRKKQYVVYVLVSFAVIAGVFVVVNSTRQVKPPELVTQRGEEQIQDIAPPETRGERFAAKQEPIRQRRSPSKGAPSSRPEGLREEDSTEIEVSRELPSSEPPAGAVPETGGGEDLTAREWFEMGRALDDESEEEVEFYEKALEMNPEFAPAYYRLGAIHFRRAKYELADQEFAKFIQHASEAEKQTYDIYVYYSPSDMERLSAAAVTEKESDEEDETEASAEETGEVSAEVEGEEKETPSESKEVEKTAEDANTETAVETEEAETEEIEKETPEETGEAETETAAETPKEAEEEAEY